jgi:iron complex outermembrane recepter protein
LNAKLSGGSAKPVLINLRTTYRIDECWQLRGLVNNLFDNRDALYGAYFDPSNPRTLVTPALSDPRTLILRQPMSCKPGLKLAFYALRFSLRA